MIYGIEIKHDTLHKTWRPLSVTSKSPEALKNDLLLYVQQWAADNQANPDMIAGRVVSKEGDVWCTLTSNAQANKPK